MKDITRTTAPLSRGRPEGTRVPSFDDAERFRKEARTMIAVLGLAALSLDTGRRSARLGLSQADDCYARAKAGADGVRNQIAGIERELDSLK
jgi:hypothetical protein